MYDHENAERFFRSCLPFEKGLPATTGWEHKGRHAVRHEPSRRITDADRAEVIRLREVEGLYWWQIAQRLDRHERVVAEIYREARRVPR